jgi:hypothetical protein
LLFLANDNPLSKFDDPYEEPVLEPVVLVVGFR